MTAHYVSYERNEDCQVKIAGDGLNKEAALVCGTPGQSLAANSSGDSSGDRKS